SRDNVSVVLKVMPAQGDIVISVAPQVSNLGENLKASFQTTSVTVKLHGDLPTLRALQSGAVKAVVNADGQDVGAHVLVPAITAPEGIQVVSFDPGQVVL